VRLYLVRHAIAHDADPVCWPDDALRPLTALGVRRFRRAARGVRALAPGVDVLLTSPFERARATAEILREAAGWPAPVTTAALRSGASTSEQLAAIAEHGPDATVAAVGHEPDLQMLASYLLTGSEYGLASLWRKGAIAALECPASPTPGSATLLWFLPPSALRRLAR
jgi:phosphohistidine phosphatase